MPAIHCSEMQGLQLSSAARVTRRRQREEACEEACGGASESDSGGSNAGADGENDDL